MNSELKVLEEGIRRGLTVLKPGRRMVVLSYHSGEDRVVKTLFRQAQRGEIDGLKGKTFTVLTRKPLEPSPEEVTKNPRSRSAKLRAIAREA